jgi:hypothetical protein
MDQQEFVTVALKKTPITDPWIDPLNSPAPALQHARDRMSPCGATSGHWRVASDRWRGHLEDIRRDIEEPPPGGE